MKDNRKHTPGHWIVQNTRRFDQYPPMVEVREIVNAKGNIIACAVYSDKGNEQLANAHLLAAAPELMEACRNAMEIYEHIKPACCEEFVEATYEKLKAAIAKAEGRE
uniref:Uncharacterized protein n=1 Tax=viral metagenome TaxID=1070528 RepID=A0A6H1ZA77_9ZZZZ